MSGRYPPYFSIPDDLVVVIEPTQVPDMRDKDGDRKEIKSKHDESTFSKWKMRVEAQGVKPDSEWGNTRDWMMFEEEYDLFQLISNGSYKNVKGRQFKVWKEDKKLCIETDEGNVYRHSDLDPNREPKRGVKNNPTPWKDEPKGQAAPAQSQGFKSVGIQEVLTVRAMAIANEAAALRVAGIDATAEALCAAATSVCIWWEKSGCPEVNPPAAAPEDDGPPPHEDDDIRNEDDWEDRR